jgi:hypothetical protein
MGELVNPPKTPFLGLREEPAHPGSPYTILVCDGEPTDEQRIVIARRTLELAEKTRESFKWNMGVVGADGPNPGLVKTVSVSSGGNLSVMAPSTSGSQLGKPGGGVESSPTFEDLEHADTGRLEDGINAMVQTFAPAPNVVTGQTPPVKIDVRPGETPLEAARRIAKERINQS